MPFEMTIGLSIMRSRECHENWISLFEFTYNCLEGRIPLSAVRGEEL